MNNFLTPGVRGICDCDHRNLMATILKADNLEKVYRIGKVDVPACVACRLQCREGIRGRDGTVGLWQIHDADLLAPVDANQRPDIVDGEDLRRAQQCQRTGIRAARLGLCFQRFNLFPT